MNQQLLHREELKRRRCWDPYQQWRVLQETITWTDQQQPTPRNSQKACLIHQTRLQSRSNDGKPAK